jgi:hypothetical protein
MAVFEQTRQWRGCPTGQLLIVLQLDISIDGIDRFTIIMKAVSIVEKVNEAERE